jgi:hypothetical protein
MLNELSKPTKKRLKNSANDKSIPLDAGEDAVMIKALFVNLLFIIFLF